ncbi:DsbE family thiol:disulfide interchange protein [Bradyrhizobium sp. BR13661]|jgi:cytochrome c biogenesis protein CcmG/thiol:disulfide interchange protein DsbE|uniref:DsbE family thiol:disulfide interchange protein n=1 Tax=Bradyrhizobium sp. BR13661 TaxID=2940622 RepID=UPI00247304E9|nr:DsbE family thiol:disulfide interchange protein [Bradyrhizobium sp. BR13661]MDH6256443.1 cytochrome c biogenesis protein CcmG/thiol:disulfide interchange protein DsbE [Bradyrhizobium sp. BR13661]
MPPLSRTAPLAVFVLLVAGFAYSLTNDPRRLPSTLIDKPVPSFNLAALDGGNAGLSDQDLKGGITLLNVFASWCPGCRYEHPTLIELAERSDIRIVGLNWKDRQRDAARWLQSNKSPYARVGLDESGRVGIDLGVTGVPETFVIDRGGRIRFRYPGPLTEDVWHSEFEPLLNTLRSGS